MKCRKEMNSRNKPIQDSIIGGTALCSKVVSLLILTSLLFSYEESKRSEANGTNHRTEWKVWKVREVGKGGEFSSFSSWFVSLHSLSTRITP